MEAKPWSELSGKEKAQTSLGCGLLVLGLLAALSMCSSDEDIEAQPNPEAGSAPAEVVRAANKFQEDLRTAMAKCDLAGQRLQEKFAAATDGSGDFYSAYDEAQFAEQACHQNSRSVSAIEIPSVFSDKGQLAAENAIDACKSAMTAKAMMADSFSTVLDGDTRPSAISEVREAGNYVQLRMSECAANILEVNSANGISIEQAAGSE